MWSIGKKVGTIADCEKDAIRAIMEEFMDKRDSRTRKPRKNSRGRKKASNKKGKPILSL